jgi:hypothetical protein
VIGGEKKKHINKPLDDSLLNDTLLDQSESIINTDVMCSESGYDILFQSDINKINN